MKIEELPEPGQSLVRRWAAVMHTNIADTVEQPGDPKIAAIPMYVGACLTMYELSVAYPEECAELVDALMSIGPPTTENARRVSASAERVARYIATGEEPKRGDDR